VLYRFHWGLFVHSLITRMSAATDTRRFSFDDLVKYTSLTQDVAQHLVKVYTTLGLALAAAATGAIFQLYFNVGGILSFLGAFAMLIWLTATPTHNVELRTRILLGFALLEGVTIGPLVEAVLEIDPQYVFVVYHTFNIFLVLLLLLCSAQSLYLQASLERRCLPSAVNTCTLVVYCLLSWYVNVRPW